MQQHPQAPHIRFAAIPHGFRVMCEVCRVGGGFALPRANAFIRQHANCRIVGLGDVIAGATKAFGVKPCAPCQKRAAVLNRKVPLFRRRGY